MARERYSIRFDKDSKRYDVFYSGFVPMYCDSYDTKQECREYIKEQNKYEKELEKEERTKNKEQ